MHFSISLDAENPTVSKEHPLLKRCRILNGDKWIGTVFLNPDCSGNYPHISEPCEFIYLTHFKAYTHSIATSYLKGLVDMSVEEKEPAIFPADYNRVAHAEHKRQFEAWKSGSYHAKMGYRRRQQSWMHEQGEDPHRGMPYPAHFSCSHVMWIERKGDVVYRKAIGIVGGDASYYGSSRIEELCLG